MLFRETGYSSAKAHQHFCLRLIRQIARKFIQGLPGRGARGLRQLADFHRSALQHLPALAWGQPARCLEQRMKASLTLLLGKQIKACSKLEQRTCPIDRRSFFGVGD